MKISVGRLFVMPPFGEAGAYCFADVGPSVDQIVTGHYLKKRYRQKAPGGAHFLLFSMLEVYKNVILKIKVLPGISCSSILFHTYSNQIKYTISIPLQRVHVRPPACRVLPRGSPDRGRVSGQVYPGQELLPGLYPADLHSCHWCDTLLINTAVFILLTERLSFQGCLINIRNTVKSFLYIGHLIVCIRW